MRLRAMSSTVTIALLACSLVPVAHAQPTYGYDLSWNDCINLPGAAANIDYACDGSRDGNPFKLIVTFVSPSDLPKFVAVDVHMVVRTNTNSQPLPDWWRLDQGECHEGAITFPSSRDGIGTGTTGACVDPWAVGSTGGGYQWDSEMRAFETVPNPGWGYLQLAFALSEPVVLAAGQRYLLPPVLIDPAATLGGTCAGCDLPACIAVTGVELIQEVGSPGGDIIVMEYRPIDRLFVTWQGGGIGGIGCPLSVPTRRATWGAIKAIYR